MGLRIRTNVASLKSQRNLSQITNKTENSMSKLSSGYRINKSADDAAGLAISETFKGKIRSMNQAKRNANDAISMVQVAEGGMNEISNILIRLRELATQAATDTLGNLERSYTNKEYDELVDEVDRIVNSAEFNGMRLLKGSDGNDGISDLVFHIGVGNDTVPNRDSIHLNIDDIKLNAEDVLGLGKGAEIGPMEADGSFSRADASEKLSIIDTAIKKVAANRAVLGSKQSRLSSTITNLGISIENAQSANSRIRDVDYAAEAANMTQLKILGQAGVSVLAQANTFPQLALNLLR